MTKCPLPSTIKKHIMEKTPLASTNISTSDGTCVVSFSCNAPTPVWLGKLADYPGNFHQYLHLVNRFNIGSFKMICFANTTDSKQTSAGDHLKVLFWFAAFTKDIWHQFVVGLIVQVKLIIHHPWENLILRSVTFCDWKVLKYWVLRCNQPIFHWRDTLLADLLEWLT